MEKLDAICMQLIAIGESLENLYKVTDHKRLPSYPEVDWKKANQTNIKNPPRSPTGPQALRLPACNAYILERPEGVNSASA